MNHQLIDLAVVDHGQLCFSTERIIVHRGVYDDFVKYLTTAFSNTPPAGDAVTRQSAKVNLLYTHYLAIC